MVAALILLNHKVAFLALSIVQVVLHEQKLLFVTIPLMNTQQTFAAKLFPACVANEDVIGKGFVGCPDHPLAVLLGTQFGIGVLGDHLELADFLVLLLDVGWKSLEEVGGHVQHP